ncbi:hypothetical protein [Lacrimispora amygdalina]|uniref:hypothetical protein n=1 Tax=Lacrimispora amygdalina TaxID=253257 RepID=UPI001478619F|nr:hypothetical protein [Clostridium indicum]
MGRKVWENFTKSSDIVNCTFCRKYSKLLIDYRFTDGVEGVLSILEEKMVNSYFSRNHPEYGNRDEFHGCRRKRAGAKRRL